MLCAFKSNHWLALVYLAELLEVPLDRAVDLARIGLDPRLDAGLGHPEVADVHAGEGVHELDSQRGVGTLRRDGVGSRDAQELLPVALPVLHQRVVEEPQLEVLRLAPLFRGHERAPRVPRADREHAGLLVSVEVPVPVGQSHAGQGLRVGPEVDQLLVVPEDLHDARILPGDLPPAQPDELVTAQLAQEQVHGNEQGGPFAVGGPRRERGVAGLRAGGHHLPELILCKREVRRHGDPELPEELLVVVDLVGRRLQRKGPDPDLASGPRPRPERLGVRLHVAPANAAWRGPPAIRPR